MSTTSMLGRPLVAVAVLMLFHGESRRKPRYLFCTDIVLGSQLPTRHTSVSVWEEEQTETLELNRRSRWNRSVNIEIAW